MKTNDPYRTQAPKQFSPLRRASIFQLNWENVMYALGVIKTFLIFGLTAVIIDFFLYLPGIVLLLVQRFLFVPEIFSTDIKPADMSSWQSLNFITGIFLSAALTVVFIVRCVLIIDSCSSGRKIRNFFSFVWRHRYIPLQPASGKIDYLLEYTEED